MRKNYPFEGFVEWHRKEVLGGEVDNYRSMFNIADIISADLAASLQLAFDSGAKRVLLPYPRLWIFQQFRQSCLPSFR